MLASKESPPHGTRPITTKCINKVFKNDVASRLSIPECIEQIEEFVKSQLCQFELAITGEGLYRFRANYRDLEVPKEEWLKKSKEEKKKHVAKVFGCQVRPVATIQNNPSMELGGGECNLEQLRQDNEFAAPIQRGRKISFSFRIGAFCRYSTSLISHYVEESRNNLKF